MGAIACSHLGLHVPNVLHLILANFAYFMFDLTIFGLIVDSLPIKVVLCMFKGPSRDGGALYPL